MKAVNGTICPKKEKGAWPLLNAQKRHSSLIFVTMFYSISWIFVTKIAIKAKKWLEIMSRIIKATFSSAPADVDDANFLLLQICTQNKLTGADICLQSSLFLKWKPEL